MQEPPPGPLTVLHADDALVAVSKPAWLMVHRSREAPDTDVALQRVRDQLGGWVYPVHRLDRQSSGVLVFGRTPEAAGALQGAWDQARKHYLTLVRGEVEDAWDCTRPLTKRKGALKLKPGDERIVQEARTSFRKVASFYRSSLVIASLDTGRRHQIRRHLAGDSHQIIGDRRYGKSKINAHHKEELGLERMFLHAWRLTVPHPDGGELALEAPLADDLVAYLKRIPDVPAAVWETIGSSEAGL